MSPVQIAVLMPHAPVLVPEVAGERLCQVHNTVAAMRDVAQRVVWHQPDAIVLVSPHSPRRRRSFGVWTGPRHVGSLRQFRAPDVGFDLPNDPQMIADLEAAMEDAGLDLWKIDDEDLDHGAVVPLWFLCEAGWRGPTTILSLNYPGQGGLQELGHAVASASTRSGRKIAFIASGDMSHRLQPDAPGGYHPQAQHFDEEFIHFVDEGQVNRLLDFDPDLQEAAGEDALDATLVALGSVDNDMHGHRVLDYEGPFGVGYGVAVLHERDGDTRASAISLARVARTSVEAALGMCEAARPEPDADFLRERMPVFVTIRTREGNLRGCVGTVQPRRANLIEETWCNARTAAFEDQRFKPIRADELDELVFEVSVLHSFEDVTDESQIDPHTHGVLVLAFDGRRGLLLPDIDGIDTAEEQIAIARRKGHISEDEAVHLQRFQVDKFKE